MDHLQYIYRYSSFSLDFSKKKTTDETLLTYGVDLSFFFLNCKTLAKERLLGELFVDFLDVCYIKCIPAVGG